MSDRLSKEKVDALLGEDNPFTIQIYDCIASTNTTAKEAARNGSMEGLVILADRQIGGYGRYGRSFHSPGGTGLYMSILLRPKAAASTTLFLTIAAAAAVAEAIEETTGKVCGIKWVNDLFLDGKKVCGILTEGAITPSSDRLDYAVLGIGINVTEPKNGFPDELQLIAGSIVKDNTADLRNRLAAAILSRFARYYRNFEDKAFYASYCERLFFLGQSILVLKNGQETVATAICVDDDFRLHVRYEDGSEEALSSAEIAIKV